MRGHQHPNTSIATPQEHHLRRDENVRIGRIPPASPTDESEQYTGNDTRQPEDERDWQRELQSSSSTDNRGTYWLKRAFCHVRFGGTGLYNRFLSFCSHLQARDTDKLTRHNVTQQALTTKHCFINIRNSIRYVFFLWYAFGCHFGSATHHNIGNHIEKLDSTNRFGTSDSISFPHHFPHLSFVFPDVLGTTRDKSAN